MRIKMTARELMDTGLWQDFCEETGMNEWAMAEGLLDSDDEVEIPENLISKVVKNSIAEKSDD